MRLTLHIKMMMMMMFFGLRGDGFLEIFRNFFCILRWKNGYKMVGGGGLDGGFKL